MHTTRTRRPLFRRTSLILLAVMALVLFSGVPPKAFGITQSGLESLVREGGLYDPLTECAEAGPASSGMDGVSITGESSVVSGDPLTLTQPSVGDPVAFGKALVDHIKKDSPNSPWLDIPDLATKLVKEGQERNVNMMVVVSIAQQESQIGTSNVATRNKNSFGNKGNGPGGYLAYPSFEASLFGTNSFTKAFSDRITGKHPSYKEVKNLYEYLSVHVSGQIIYQGDTTVVHDEIMDESVDDKAVIIYFRNVTKWISDMTGYNITGYPKTKGSPTVTASGVTTSTGVACPTNTSAGAVGLDGYFWPVDPRTKRSYTDAPCKRENIGCHWNGGPAFDLYFGRRGNMDNRKVYALLDGKVVSKSQYGSNSKCFEIQYKGKDNFFYWYGHITNPQTGDNGKFNGGQHMANVAPNSFGESCRRGRDHLHIDRGCSINGVPQHGGSPDCRDVRFVKLMNDLWEILPEDKNE